MSDSGRKKTLFDVDNVTSQLVDKRQGLRGRMIKERRFDLQEQVKVREKEVEILTDGQQPANLFPEEIWLMILEHLTDDLDAQRNIIHAHSSFKVLLEQVGKLVLFRKVLPILHRGNYLSTMDILSYRLVSKTMCPWINDYFVSSDSWRTSKCLQPKQLQMSVPSVEICNQSLETRELLDNSRNPFVSRAVRLSLPQAIIPSTPLDPVEYDGLIRRLRAARRGRWFVNELLERDSVKTETKRNILEKFGPEIWYLTLELTDLHYIYGKNVLYCLENCPNLRRFEICESRYYGQVPVGVLKFQKGLISLNLPHLSSLVLPAQSIQCSGNSPFFHIILNFQNALVDKFSGQLKELQVTHWNDAYCDLDWSNLKTLVIGECDSIKKLKGICEMKASKVEKLSLKLCGNNKGNLQLLLETIHHFLELKELTLKFDWQWEINEEEVKSFPATTIDICSTSLKRVHLMTGFSDKITFSFLVYFPYLENLHISYGCEGLDSEEDFDDPSSIGNTEKPLLNNELYRRWTSGELKSKIDQELVEVRNYLYLNRADIHKSVVWNILPFLKGIKTTESWRSDRAHFYESYEFQRKK